MRIWLVVAAWGAMACGAGRRPEAETLAARARVTGCTADGNQIALDGLRAEEERGPVIVLVEGNDNTGTGTAALWADGRVLFDPRSGGATLEARMSAVEVEQLRLDAYARLGGQPRGLRLMSRRPGGPVWDHLHANVTDLYVRGPDGWRVVRAHGIGRDDALSPRAPDDDPAALAHAEARWAELTARGDARNLPRPLFRDRPPRWFLDAYRVLLAALPTAGTPWVPVDHDLTLFADDEPRPFYGAPTAWPDGLPVPPPSLDARTCDPYDTAGCTFALGPAHRDAVARARPGLRDAEGRARPAAFAGHRWFLRFDPRHDGQAAFDTVRACVSTLDETRVAAEERAACARDRTTCRRKDGSR